MSWFGKKDKKEADFSSNSELPPLPDDFEKEQVRPIKNELPPLPTFPQSKTADKLGEDAVKQAVKSSEMIPEEDEEPIGLNRMPLTREIEEETFVPAPKFEMPTKTSSKLEPVYVRIDKYQESLQAFSDVKKKIMEIESILREVKELKQKEDTELQEWTDEVQKAKLKLGEIDSDLFQKLG